MRMQPHEMLDDSAHEHCFTVPHSVRAFATCLPCDDDQSDQTVKGRSGSAHLLPSLADKASIEMPDKAIEAILLQVPGTVPPK